MNESADQEEQIFAEALLVPPAERDRYLARACGGNAALRRQVDALLLAHESAGAFMTPRSATRGKYTMPSLSQPTPAAKEAGDTEGSVIGRYKLLQKLGEGGCGVVWMAEQQEPVRRRVALKVIKLGMDTKTVVARFEAERQALALMDHPNIARVFEAGATETGRPFFVMELVPGVPITKYCDQNNLSTTARLELFRQVCQAVQHAHQKGVIHRDLKPSNVLVTLHDGEPSPKVIDFGIAKATQGRLTDHTLFTAFEQFIGTPAYMSPEQAEISGIDIDTRSDIYSLGVLLYELLTGRQPFDSKSLLSAGLEEIRRIIREVEPPKPSTRLNTLADSDRDQIARHRGTAPAQLSLLLRGDLDWIVMKALEKNRNRRYDTASDLALDIQRHLQNEAVVARPPTAGYRISRLIRRNRFTFIAGGAVALALVIGLVVSTAQTMRARAAERAAETARAKAQTERARAEDLFGFMLGDLRAQLAKVGRLDVLESVGDKALAYFASVKPDELDDATLGRHAQALTQIGEIRMDQARFTEAAAAFTEAYNRTTALVTRRPKDGDTLFARGQAEYWNGFVQWKRGNLTGAAEWLQRYRTTSLALVDLDASRSTWQSELAYSQKNLATLQLEQGDFAEAKRGFLLSLATLEQMQTARPTDLGLGFRIADVQSWLGGLADQLGEYAEAAERFALSAAQLRQLVRLEPKTARWRFELADALLFEADLAITTGKPLTAGEKLQEARTLLDELGALEPANRSWKIASLNTRIKESVLARHQNKLSESTALVEDTVRQLEKLTASESSGRARLWLAKAWRVASQLRAPTDRPSAIIAANRAVELGEILVRDTRAKNEITGEFATACVVAGEIAAKSGAPDAATRYWQRALEALAAAPRLSRDWRVLDPAARALFRLGRTDEARSKIDQLTGFGYVPLDPWPAINDLSVPQQQPR